MVFIQEIFITFHQPLPKHFRASEVSGIAIDHKEIQNPALISLARIYISVDYSLTITKTINLPVKCYILHIFWLLHLRALLLLINGECFISLLSECFISPSG